MEAWFIILLAKLIDWPTIAMGTCAGLLAGSWRRVLPMALVASLIAELLIMQVRGWAFSPTLFTLGIIAALPWVMLGFGLRSLLRRWIGALRRDELAD